MKATLADIAEIEARGYSVQPLDCGMGPVAGQWTLTYAGGGDLMIGAHGCVSPTKWEAVAEAQARIAEES